MECVICLENVNEPFKKWKCNHNHFHKECIAKWNKGCPICKCNELIDCNVKYEKNHNLDLNYMNRLIHVSEIEYNYYHQLWKFKECKNCHHVKYVFSGIPPFGVIGFCQQCDIVQCFPRLRI